jgi:hypothetical protein
MSKIIDSAEQFLWLSGRVLDRLRFDQLFRGGHPQRVRDALLPYRNSDGGFGQGLEPDFRGPVSQPLCLESALRALVGIEDADTLLKPALDWALSVRSPDGGVPNVLGDVSKYPRAPWWVADPKQPGSLLPTASIAGLLLQRKSTHPFAREVSAFCFAQLEAMPTRLARAKERLPKLQALYETRAGLLFLSHTPERERASKLAAQLGEAVKPLLDPESKEMSAPLDFASRPSSLARRWFDDATIEQQLKWLRSEQQSDGGFPIGWEAFTPAAGTEWRAIQTLERLETLHAYEALR